MLKVMHLALVMKETNTKQTLRWASFGFRSFESTLVIPSDTSLNDGLITADCSISSMKDHCAEAA
jgi:hypothetical protein